MSEDHVEGACADTTGDEQGHPAFAFRDVFSAAKQTVSAAADTLQGVPDSAIGGAVASVAGSIGETAGSAFSAAAQGLGGMFKGREREVSDAMEEQDDEAIDFAIRFLKELIRLRGVRIDREQFLRAELRKKGVSESAIDLAVEKRPAEADIPCEVLDAIADESIAFETKKSAAMSFAAGIPGGFALIGTVPVDLTQYYVHAFRVMQKLAYLYGWTSLLEECKEVDDETLALLGLMFGVMLGVTGASKSLTVFALKVVAPSVQKRVASMALTKTAWYLPLRGALRFIGLNITKQSVGKAVSKVVPIVGGVISGGMTLVSLGSESNRLKKHLRTLPPARPDTEITIEDFEELSADPSEGEGDPEHEA